MVRQLRQRIFAMLTAIAMLLSWINAGTFAEENTGNGNNTPMPICGMAEHLHTEDCYAPVLICGLEESEPVTEKHFRNTFMVHRHSNECYDAFGNQICGLIENEYYHTHNEYCRDENGNLVCGLETRKPHVHTEECYQQERVLTCGKEETAGNTHDASCYEHKAELICGQEEDPGHIHGETCYEEHRELACGLKEDEGHHHSEACYTERQELTCGLEEDPGHIHSESCWQEITEYLCGLEESEEHTHSEACLKTEKILVCGETEREGHTHTDECYTTYHDLTCTETERDGHIHTEDCYTISKELICTEAEREGHIHTEECRREWDELICEQEEKEAHTHDDTCYETINALICDKPTTTHQHTEACYNEQGNLICGKLEIPTFTCTEENWEEEIISEGHHHSEACYEQQLVCSQPEHTHTEACYPQPAEDPTEDPANDQTGDTTEDQTGDTTEDQTGDTTDDPAENQAGDTAEDQTEDPAEDQTEDPTDDTTEDLNDDQTGDATDDPTEDPTGDTTDDPDEDPTGDTTDNPTENPIDDTTGDSTDDQTGDTTDNPTEDSAVDTTDDPVEDQTGDTTNDPTEDQAGDTTEDLTEDQTGDTADDSAEDQMGDITDDPAEALTGDTTDDPAEDLTGDTTDDPTEDPTDDTTDDPVEDQTGDTTNDPTKDQAGDTTNDPTEDQTGDTTDDSAEDQAGDTAEDQTKEPTEDQTSDSTDDPTEDPTGDTTDDPTEDLTDDTTGDPTEDQTGDTAEDQTEEPTEDQTSDSTDDPTEDPAGDTTNDPAEDQTGNTTEDPTDDQTGDTNDDPAEDQTGDTTDDLTEDQTEDTAEDQTEEPTEDQTSDSTDDPAEDQTGDTTDDPIEDQTGDSTDGPADDPTEDPIEDTSEEPTEVTIPSAEDAPYKVSVTFSSDAGIPDGTELVVTDTEQNDHKGGEETQTRNSETKGSGTRQLRMMKAARTVEEPHAEIGSLMTWSAGETEPEIILYRKTIDFSLMIDGEEIEPNPGAEITVNVCLPGIEAGQDIEVTHEGEVLESTNDAGNVTFVTGSFSPFTFTSRAQQIDSRSTEQTENTFYGKTADQSVDMNAIEVSDVTEGLTVEEAFSTTADGDLWMTMHYTNNPPSGKLESMTLYQVEDGKLGGIVRENVNTSEMIRFNLGDLSSYALVKDSGLRRMTQDLDQVTLSGMMPKNANATAVDVTEQYAEHEFVVPDEPSETEDPDENEEPANNDAGEEPEDQTGTSEDKRTTLAAYDISILNQGDEYQPDKDHPIAVEIVDSRITGQDIELWHIKDDGTEEQVKEYTVEDGRIEFEATGFSVYIIINHESGIVVVPRVEFHFITDSNPEPTAVETNGQIEYYIGGRYPFKNKSADNEIQYSQILKNGESLELITDPGNKTEKYFYGWYIVDPKIIDGTTNDYGFNRTDKTLYYSWPSAPVSVTFESPISIQESSVNIGDTVHWSINSVSGSGTVDSDGNLHILLAPVFEKYNFVNFMLYPREQNEDISKTLMTRKMIALGSSSSVEVKISDIQSASTDPVHLIFTGWEYNTGSAEEPRWEYKQTVDYTGAEMKDSGKDGVYLNANLEDKSSIDLYPKFIQARWVDFFSGISGSGATYVASRFRESWGSDPDHSPEGMVENINGEKNVFTSLPVPRRDGYQFGGWYAFAVTDPQTGEIENLNEAKSVSISYLDELYHSHTYTGDMQAVKITDGNGAIAFNDEQKLTIGEETYFLFTGDNNGIKLFDGIDRLTLYANWIPIDTEITIVYWTENALDKGVTESAYTASATKTISTSDLSRVLPETYTSGSVITLDTLIAYDDLIEETDPDNMLVNHMILDDVGAVPKKDENDTTTVSAREEIFFERNNDLTRSKNTYQTINDQGDSINHEGKIIDGQGTTSFNVYFSRRTFQLVFHIGRDRYCKAGGQQREDGDNWLEYMYTDSIVPQRLGRQSRGTATASYEGEAHMTYEGKTYDSTYVTDSSNILLNYLPDPENIPNDQNLYIITAKYGEYIGDRWPSPVNSAFTFDQITYKNTAYTPYIWTAAYSSLYHVISFKRDSGGGNGSNADINGMYKYLSAELCADRTGDHLINSNQVHHLVAWFGQANNQEKYKKYHFMYEMVDGINLPENNEIRQGNEFLTYLQTTWSAANTNGEGVGVILNNTYYENKDESPVPVVSNLAPQFQLGSEVDGYRMVYSCYYGTKIPDPNDSSKRESHVYFFYTPKEYKLTFMFESGAVEETYLYGQSLAGAEKAVPEKEGYYFDGWYNNEAGEGDRFNFANERMPSEGIVLYPVYRVLQYNVKIDPNGGVIDHINYSIADKYGNKANDFGVDGTGYNQSQATYFTANYGTTIGEYTIKREYIRLTEKEMTPGTTLYYNPNDPDQQWYYYVNTQLDGIYDGDWGLPPNLRNAVYMTEDQLRKYHKFYKDVAADNLEYYTGVTILEDFNDFAAAYTSYPGQAYRKLKEAERYSFMGWYQVTDEGISSMPFNFNEPVLGDMELRAQWRLDGGYYLQYNPVFIVDDGDGNLVSVTGDMPQWMDPAIPSKQLYADQAPTHILNAPDRVRENWVFRGWRVVKKTGEKTAIVDGTQKTYDEWSPIQYNENGDIIYYQPGDNFVIDSNLISDTTTWGSVIHMQAYYEPEGLSVRRPEIANLTLDANGGYITADESTELSQNDNLPTLGENGTVLLDASDDKIIFGDIQSNISVHLTQYAVSSQYQDYYTVLPHNYFKHSGAYFLLGFDRHPDDDYIAEFPADSVIAVQRKDKETLFAVWEKMVYVNFINTTDKDITIELTGTGESTVSIVNVATGLFDREKTESTITIPARANGVDGKAKIVLPGAVPGVDEFTATAVNDHIRTRMSVEGAFPEGIEYANMTPSTDVKYGGSVIYKQVLREDMNGIGIIVTYTEEPVEEVIYDVNGGNWENPTSPDSNYEHQMGDIYALPKEAIEADPSHDYHPIDPTRAGMIFVGWTDNPDIAGQHNFSSETEVKWGDTTIVPDEGSNVLKKIQDEYLWNFETQAPPYDRTLYAVWSETATVTFNLTMQGSNNHRWTDQETTTKGNYVYYRASNGSNTITYTVMKGEKVPRPSDPLYNESQNAGQYFLEWLTVASYIKENTVRPIISNYIFDFDKPLHNDIIVYTSWKDKNHYQTYTFTVQNHVIDEIVDDDEFTYTISIEDIEKYTGSAYVQPKFESVTTQLKNNESYTIRITIIKEPNTKNTPHTYDGYDVYAEVIDRDGNPVPGGSGHLMRYEGDDEARTHYKYMLRVAQTQKAGYSTNVSTDTAEETLLALFHDQFTFTSRSGSHYNQVNAFAGGVSNNKTITFTNWRKDNLTITKNVKYDLGDRNSDFTFTLVSVEDETTGMEYKYTKAKNDGSTESDWLATKDGSNTFTLKHGESITIELPHNKDVVISEDNTNYSTVWSATDQTVTLSNADTETVTLNLTGNAATTVTNTRETRTVTVKKIVDPVDTSRSFNFTALIIDGSTAVTNYAVYTDAENSSNSILTNSNGQANFSLVHNGTQTLTIPYGAKLVVTEGVTIGYMPSAAMVDGNDDPIPDDDEADGSFTINSVAQNGTITFTNTQSVRNIVLFDTNGGTWTETSGNYVALTAGLYEIEEDSISENNYYPADPTQSRKVFIGWTEYADIATIATDFSQTDPVTLGEISITPNSDGIVLDKIRNEYLWDFNRPVSEAYGKTLYAVWSDAVTVTFDIVRTGSNLHTWVGPATTGTQVPYVYYRNSDISGTITYTLAKGEKVPQPSDPTTDQTNWNFAKWLLNNTTMRNKTENPSNPTIVGKAYDFSLRVESNITLSTSWTTTQSQIFTFTVENRVNCNPNEEFTYTIAVSNEKVYGKIGTSSNNSYGDPDRKWGSVITTLKNNETYTIQIKVLQSTKWNPSTYSIEIDVIDREGNLIKSGHVIYCNNNTNNSSYAGKNFTSDYKYRLTITQDAKAGYETTVGIRDRNNVDSPVDYYTDTANPPVNCPETSDAERRFTFTSIHSGTQTQASNFTPLNNQFTGNESNSLTVVFTNTSLSRNLTVTKTVAGTDNTSDVFDFTAEVEGIPDEVNYWWQKYSTSDGTTYTSMTGTGSTGTGTLTSNANTIDFTLGHHQKIVIGGLPDSAIVTVTENNGLYTAAWLQDGNAIQQTDGDGTSSVIIALTMNSVLEVTNTKTQDAIIVAPTLYTSHHTPFVILLMVGVLLLTLDGVWKVKTKRDRVNIEGKAISFDVGITNTGPPGGGRNRAAPVRAPADPETGQRTRQWISARVMKRKLPELRGNSKRIPRGRGDPEGIPHGRGDHEG